MAFWSQNEEGFMFKIPKWQESIEETAEILTTLKLRKKNKTQNCKNKKMLNGQKEHICSVYGKRLTIISLLY